jgi:phosphoribosylformimino-5-aminoimidazole carboxamide ribotide isomerase
MRGGSMIVIPAIDLRGGRAVRLVRGDPDSETEYAADPVEAASRFQEEGARRLHVVDLDAALGDGDNREVMEAICRTVQVPVQVGGGIRTLEDIGALLEAGAARAILGTAAAADPTFVRRAVEEYAEAIVVAVDVRGGHVMVKGWKEEGPALEEAVSALDDAGAPRYLVTSIARDGTLNGPDITLYEHVLRVSDVPVIASGGVRDADDVWSLRDLGCEAVVTGKALYEKTLKLSQVIRG